MAGLIIQQYHGAEDGSLHASNYGYFHWYIDRANYEGSPSQWSIIEKEWSGIQL